jgi:hypothetical protein
VEESKEEPRLGRFCITRKWLVIWAVSSSIVILVCYLVRPYVYYDDEFSVLVNAMNVISYVLAIGLPAFLSASIVFGTSTSRAHISALLKSGKSTVAVFLRCLIEVYGLVLLFSASISSVLFLEPQLMGTSFHRPEGTGFLIYLPPVLIATLVVSLLLASVGVLFVMITDDIIISTAIGCVLTIGLATLVGWNSFTLWESLTRGLAMLSPSNLARILAASISGYDSADSFTIASYFGFTATLSSILLALAIFGFIVFIGLIASIKVFQNNTLHGMTDGRTEKSPEIWESEPERREEHAKIKQRMKIRRLALAGLIMIMLTITAVGTASYANTVVAETTIIFHQSPEGGEQITLGEWYIFSCDVRPPQYGVMNIMHYECIFEDWRDCPEELSFYYCMVKMSSSDFQLLNETGRRSVCGDAMNYTQDDWGAIGSSRNIGFDYGPYTFALKAIAAENETIAGSLYCSITLSQSPTFY